MKRKMSNAKNAHSIRQFVEQFIEDAKISSPKPNPAAELSIEFLVKFADWLVEKGFIFDLSCEAENKTIVFCGANEQFKKRITFKFKIDSPPIHYYLAKGGMKIDEISDFKPGDEIQYEQIFSTFKKHCD